jgi:hypothetical protein
MSKPPWFSTMRSSFRPALPGLLVAAVTAFLASATLQAQTYTVQSITAPDFGIVAAATSGTTSFVNNGSVSVGSGSGAFVSGAVTRGSVSIRCVNGVGVARRCNNANNNARVTVATNGSVAGRGQSLTSFTAAAGSGVTLIGSTTGASLDMVMSGWTATNQDRTFSLDVTMPVVGDNASLATTATSGFRVWAALNPTAPTTGLTADATAVVRRSATVTKVQDIAFGTIARPRGPAQSGTVTIGFTVTAPNSGISSRTAGGATPPGIISASSFSGGLFTLSSEPGTVFSLTAPTAATMTGPGGSLPVTLVPSLSTGSHSMVPGGIGLGYGATITVSDSTNTGSYSGNFMVSISYN